MNFINRGLFTASLYKAKKFCDLFALDTILRTEEGSDDSQRDLKSDAPVSIIADNMEDPVDSPKFWEKRVYAYLRDENKRGICNVTSIDTEGPYPDIAGKIATFFIAIPIQRMVTSLDVTNVDIMKATVIRSNTTSFDWKPENSEISENDGSYNKLLLIIANIKTDDQPHMITVSEATIGKQLAQKILDNPDDKTTFHQRTLHIDLVPTDIMKGRFVKYDGCINTDIFPCETKFERKTLANKVLTRVATNIVKNAKVSDIIRSK